MYVIMELYVDILKLIAFEWSCYSFILMFMTGVVNLGSELSILCLCVVSECYVIFSWA